MEHRAGHRQPLDPLGSPFSRNLPAGHPPDLFGVILEEGSIEPAAEAVAEKILQTLCPGNGKEVGVKVAGQNQQQLAQAQGPDQLQADT